MPYAAHDWVAHHAAHQPDAPALGKAEDARMITWGELDDRVGRLARVLSDRGVGTGDRIALIGENDPRVFETQFAAMRLGALFVPLNWRLSIPEMTDIAIDAEPALLLHDEAWADAASAVADKAGIAHRLAWGGADGGNYESALSDAAYLGPRGHITFEDPTHILYTSGTTGSPKGALSTHGTLIWQALNTAAASRMAEPGNHHLNPMPLFHAGGLGVMANPILYFGGAVTTMRRFVPDQVLAALTSPVRPATHFAAIPLMYRQMSTQAGFADADFSHARQFIIAGAIAEPVLLQEWADRGVPLQPQYGGTEHGPMATAIDNPARWIDKAKKGSTGRRARHTEIRIVDPHGSDVAEGASGELWLRGPSVTVGYWGKDKSDFFTDGWYRTGDAAWRDADGFYYLVGRTKEMYKSGGENVYPAEVERVLITHPLVADVAVVGIPDATWGEVGLAVVVAEEGAELSLSELNAHAATDLARFKMPKSLALVAELPRNVTGKVNRQALKEQYGGVR
jgi:fatty-acyl-CoA synthase